MEFPQVLANNNILVSAIDRSCTFGHTSIIALKSRSFGSDVVAILST